MLRILFVGLPALLFEWDSICVELVASNRFSAFLDINGFLVRWSLLSNQFCHGSGTDRSPCRGGLAALLLSYG
jgi:hypothetical protein